MRLVCEINYIHENRFSMKFLLLSSQILQEMLQTPFKDVLPSKDVYGKVFTEKLYLVTSMYSLACVSSLR